MNSTEKQPIIADYRTHDNDTGSTGVQVALLTTRIHQLTQHLRIHKHDKATLRGLLGLVGHRRKLLKYLRSGNTGLYRSLISRLGLRA